MRRIADPIKLGALAGGVATLAKTAVSQPLVKAGFAPYDGVQKGAAMVIEPYEIRTPKGYVLGTVIDLVLGSTVGVLMATLHHRRVLRFDPVNGAVFGLGFWALWYGGLGSKFSAIGKTTAQGAFVSAGWHLVFGAVVGSIIRALDSTEDGPEPVDVSAEAVETRRNGRS